MALTEKHRNTIYQYLAPTWGDEVTQAFLSQFPAREGEEPITRDHLRAELGQVRLEIAELRGDLQKEMADLRGDLQKDMADLRGDLQKDMADLRTELGAELNSGMGSLRAEIARMGSRLAGLVITAAGVIVAAVAVAAALA